jgi:DNA primase large subunit
MASFDLTTTGFDDVLKLFKDVSARFDGDTVYLVGPSVEYAVHVELGTSKMEARPFVRPAAERVQSDFGLVSQFVDGGVLEVGEAGLVEATALAVEAEIVRIITQKNLIDTGAMRASVTTVEV